MDLSQIKLIVTDMDGTLLNAHEEPSDLFFEQFEILKQLGVHFAAASGRQYNSIAHKLAPIKDEITIIGENGGVAMRKDELIHLQVMQPESILEILPVLRKVPNIFVILCGQHSAFIESKDPKLIQMFQEYYGTHEIVEDLADVVDRVPILKIALYHPQSSEEFIYPELKSYEENFLLKISGKNWLDLSSPTSNKGTALKVVQEKMNITPEETAVFGDYLNDLEMLQCAYFSYAMENAHPEVKKVARFETASHNDLGVEKVIAEIIKAKS